MDLRGPPNTPPATRRSALAIIYRDRRKECKSDRAAELAAGLWSLPRLTRPLVEVTLGLEDHPVRMMTRGRPT